MKRHVVIKLLDRSLNYSVPAIYADRVLKHTNTDIQYTHTHKHAYHYTITCFIKVAYVISKVKLTSSFFANLDQISTFLELLEFLEPGSWDNNVGLSVAHINSNHSIDYHETWCTPS